MPKKIIFILFFVLLINNVLAQNSGYKILSDNKNVKFALNDILGNWYSLDTAKTKISFINLNNRVVEIEGIKHGVGNYSFLLKGDSIPANGTAANWPPFDCTLYLLKNNLLEIAFYQYFSKEPTRVIFTRLDNE